MKRVRSVAWFLVGLLATTDIGAQHAPTICPREGETQSRPGPCTLASTTRSCETAARAVGPIHSVIGRADLDGDGHADVLLALRETGDRPRTCVNAPTATGDAPELATMFAALDHGNGQWTGWVLARVANGDRGGGLWIEPIRAGSRIVFGLGWDSYNPFNGTTTTGVQLFAFVGTPSVPRNVLDLSIRDDAVIVALPSGDLAAIDARTGYRVLRWDATGERLVADAPSATPPPDVIAALRVRPSDADTCVVAMRTSFHLRRHDTTAAEGPELPSGTVVELLERVPAERRGRATLFRLRPLAATSGYAFVLPEDVPPACAVR